MYLVVKMVLSGVVDIIILFSAGALFGSFGGMIGGWLSNYSQHLRLQSLEFRVESLRNKIVSPMGVQARQEKAERQSEAMAKVMILVKDGKEYKEALIEVAKEYPDVALDLAKKVMTGKGANIFQSKLF